MAERRIDRVYIHCSVSTWGHENTVNGWHRARRFLTMVDGNHLSTGYHLVIGNGRPFSNKIFHPFLDGQIEVARSFDTVGAGVKSDNLNTIHICLIGMPGEFTFVQLDSLMYTLQWLHVKLKIPVDQIWGHYEFWTRKGKPPMKTCPGMNMNDFRSSFRKFLSCGLATPVKKIKIKPPDSTLHAMLRKFDSILGGHRA